MRALSTIVSAFALLAALCAACGPAPGHPSTVVQLDGSSTVLPMSQAAAEDFARREPRARLMVAVSSTRGGFERFTRGEIDVTGASRPILPGEVAQAAARGVEFVELAIAIDGICVVVGRCNDFVEDLDLGELAAVFSGDRGVPTWADVRPGWPRRPIHTFAPGTDSGTQDYFTRRVLQPGEAIRRDAATSEDDHQLVANVAGDPDAITFVGRAYFLARESSLRAIPIDAGAGPVAPTLDAIRAGRYVPLSRPLFLYVRRASLDRPAVRGFVADYLQRAGTLATELGFVPLPDAVAAAAARKLQARDIGTHFAGIPAVGVEALLERYR
ncbi:MAG: PstS family phosphate ABC transporter substrate-binding protein [Planctomycetes bacterium]|nr:PstS family phosphate ABC transporter substrate-binding protein [Planctomycetota bacterium]